MGNFNVLLACEDRFKIKFNSNEFNKLNSFKEISEVVQKNLRSIKKINSLFNRLNISENIVFHSNILVYQFEKKKKKRCITKILKFLINYIGKNGTLLILLTTMILQKEKIS